MKLLISAALTAATLFAPVATPVLASAKVAIACPAGAQESFKRAGGYCEQVESLKSIAPNGSGTTPPCQWDAMATPMMVNGRLLVAEMDPCCNVGSVGPSTFDLLPEGVLSRTDESPTLLATPCPR